MLPGLGPFPVHRKMHLGAASVALLSRDKNTLGSGFSTTLSSPRFPRAKGKGVLAAVVTPWPSSCDQTANLDLPAGASCPFLCGCPEGLAAAQFVRWASKSFVFSLILSINTSGALICARC